MSRLKGIDVLLYEERVIGIDNFNAPIIDSSPTTVSNVLVAPVSSEDVVTDLNLYGKRTVYTLGLPKGDDHDWKEKRVEFFGETFQTVGEVTKGIESMIPLEWNGKVKVVRYE